MTGVNEELETQRDAASSEEQWPDIHFHVAAGLILLATLGINAASPRVTTGEPAELGICLWEVVVFIGAIFVPVLFPHRWVRRIL